MATGRWSCRHRSGTASAGELHPRRDSLRLANSRLLMSHRLGWADPYASHARKHDDNNEADGKLTIFTKYDTFAKITKVMHLKDFASFDGRAEILGGP
jgi:hypothetical protein